MRQVRESLAAINLGAGRVSRALSQTCLAGPAGAARALSPRRVLQLTTHEERVGEISLRSGTSETLAQLPQAGIRDLIGRARLASQFALCLLPSPQNASEASGVMPLLSVLHGPDTAAYAPTRANSSIQQQQPDAPPDCCCPGQQRRAIRGP